MKFNKQTKNILLICVLYFINFKNIAQSQSSELFSDNLNLTAKISLDFKELYKGTNDSTFIFVSSAKILLNCSCLFPHFLSAP